MKKDILLMAHLMRRAGFGEGMGESNLRLLKDYDAVSYTHLTLPTSDLV